MSEGHYKDPGTDRIGCDHPDLYFGSGAFYVICQKCQQFWVARKPSPAGDCDLEYGLGASPVCGQHRRA